MAVKALAVLFTGLAVLFGAWFVRMSWTPGVDFDVTGILLLLQNSGRLAVLALFLTSCGLAVRFWLKAYLDS